LKKRLSSIRVKPRARLESPIPGLASKVLSDVFDSLVGGKSMTCRMLLEQ
jgi:hypothetical protein